MSENLYGSLARDYDFLRPYEAVLEEKPFFKALIARYNIKSCLDCACGTGSHLLMLSDMGLQCAGSDVSGEMLKHATVKLAGRKIPLREVDFRTLANLWHDTFDMVICMTTSFPHALTDEDAIQALRSMYDRLNVGGILVISNGFADRFLKEQPRFIPVQEYEDRAFYFFLDYTLPQRIDFHVLQVKHDGGMTHTHDVMPYNAIGVHKMERYFGQTRFEKVEYFGDHEFTPYDIESAQRLVVVAQKD